MKFFNKLLTFLKAKWIIVTIVASIVAICAIVIPIACVFGRKKPDPVEAIKVDTTGAKLVYELGEEFSSEGLIVRKIYKSGNESQTTDFSINSEKFNKTVEGKYVITIEYEDFSDSYSVSVVDNSEEIVDISLDITNAKTIYDIRETFSSEGLVVRSISEKGQTTLLNADDYTVNAETFNPARVGEYEISVSVGSITKTYNVNVFDLAKNVTSISLDTSNATKVFDLNDPNGFNSNGLIVRTKTESGIETAITTYTIDSSDFDITKEGSYTIRVKYATFERTYTVEVKKLIDRVTSITLDTSNAKTEFSLGERFNSDGLVVRTRTESGIETRVSGFTVNYSAYNYASAGNYAIIVSYEGLQSSYTVSVVDDPIVAISLDTSLAQTIYSPGENFSRDGLVVYSIKKSGSKARLNLSDVAINYSTFTANNTSVGNRTITVSYTYALRTYTQTYTVRIVDDAVVGFTIDTSNVNKVFNIGDTFNADGLIVRLVKESGVETVITSGYTIDNVDLSEANDSVTVTVRYRSFPAQTYTISVVDPAVEDVQGFTIDTSNVTKVFNVNDPNGFNADGLIVRAVTNSNKEIVVTNSEDITIDSHEFDVTKEGTYTIYVSYKDYEAKSYSVRVVYILDETFVALELDTTSVTKEFEQGSEFDATGLVVYKVADNGNKYPTTNYTIDDRDFDSTTARTCTIVVKFADDETITQTYKVTIQSSNVTLTVIDTTSTDTESNVKIYINNEEQTGNIITIAKDTEVKLVFTGTDNGYLFSGWYNGENVDLEIDNALSTEIEYTFNVDRTMTISALATLRTYTVTFTGFMPDEETPVTDFAGINATAIYAYGDALPVIQGTDEIRFDGWKIVLEDETIDNTIYTTATFVNDNITLTPAYTILEND